MWDSLPALKFLKASPPYPMAIPAILIVLWTLVIPSMSVERGFVYCPAYPCSCESREGALIINCMGLYLSALPKFLSFDGRIKELSLRANNIRHLPAKGFKGLHIEKLDLLDNAVTTIHDDAFHGLENSLKALSLQLYAYDGLPIAALSRLKQLKNLHIIGCKQHELDSEIFKNLASLETLHLIGCRIANIRPGALSSLTKLKCLTLSSNSLGFEDLQELDVLQHLTDLDISNNDIKMLDNQVFSKLSKLRVLNLANNKMASVAVGAFYNLDFSLEELNLQGNLLSDNALKSLRYMKSIRFLDLSANNISKIAEDDFVALRYLVSLNLANNDIRVLERKCLAGTGASLVNLDLSGNPLENIENGAFFDLSRLESLNLSQTHTGRTLTQDMFDGVSKTLKHLHVSHCDITSTQLHALTSLRHLTQLDLSFNKINHIDFQTISGWRHLTFANLSHNDISLFLVGPLNNVNSSLKALDVSSNRIQVIEECVFFLFKDLVEVKLNDNPLACNCSAAWLQRWRQITHSNSKEWSANWQCAPTKSLHRKMFSELEFSDLKCINSTKEDTRCLMEYLPWRTENASSRVSERSVTTTPSSSEKILYFNISHPNPSSIHVKWVTRFSGLVGGYKVMLTRCNDSTVVEAVTVSPDTNHYTFYPFERNVQQEICVSMLGEDLSHVETKCEGVSPVIKDRDRKSKDQHVYTVVHNSFIPLLVIYILGSLALAFIIACLVLCVRKNLSKPMRIENFYPAWIDPRSSTSSLSISPDSHMYLFEDLVAQSQRDYHAQGTLISGRGTASGRRLPPPSMRDVSSIQLNRRNSRTMSIPPVVHMYPPYDYPGMNTCTSKSLANEFMAGKSEINDDFYFHF